MLDFFKDLPTDKINDFVNNYLSKITLDYTTDDIFDIVPSHVAHIFYGATRVCFILKDCNFVIKMNRPECSSDSNLSKNSSIFSTASCEIDYCDKEAENYYEGECAGIQDILLPIRCYGTIACGYSIYIQPKYDFSWKDADFNFRAKIRNQVKQVREGKNFANILYNIYDSECIPEEWIARVIQLHGKEFMKGFENWTNALEINDLHGGNVGFKNGYPIIIDYAGCY